MDEQELRATLRTSLERHAAEADVTAPVADRARGEVRRRRRTRWSVVGAAAAVALAVGGAAVATGGDDPAQGPSTVDEGSADVTPTSTDEWRTEYWGGVAVDVPADWGYGGAPFDDGTACYPEAMIGPDGRRLRTSGDRGWVGRPIGATDVCALVPNAWEPSAPYAWLGAGVEPGTYEYDNGYVQETIEVEGVTVTVGTTDAGLRSRILATARGGEPTRCQHTYPGVPEATTGFFDSGDDGPPYAWVCAYRVVESPNIVEDGTFRLSYAAKVAPEAAADALAAQDAAPVQQVDCDYQPHEFVVLATGVPGDTYTRTVYETGCAGGTVHLVGGAKEMVAAGVKPWAHNGIPAVVYGPTGGRGAMIDSFIGPQG
ncbi:hypothetical protein DJ010_04890 [Nocardioides silvaticus]|uniref:Uncharacterized protein n=1 Tax=Nocardioides silvaticus TaxID=2201891 RepID=A0A316TJN3_9ACTN|nr:hypothetical protein [Nocardioides silvaticus]PWN03459.1 hypothetical protein DJ010_04890 [Nocardioides silvaticus]